MQENEKTDLLQNISILSGETNEDVPELDGGVHEGIGTEGPRILFVDDLSRVIETFLRHDTEYHSGDPELPCRLTTFRLADEDGARIDDFLVWLKSQPVFETIYLDGNFEYLGNGIELAEKITSIPRMEYQPITIITANASFFGSNVQNVADAPYRVLGKFDDTSPKMIQTMVMGIHDTALHSRERFWNDTQSIIATMLDKGQEIDAVSQVLGERLQTHYWVTGWYLRELRDGQLESVAMQDDLYKAGPFLALNETPEFLRSLALGYTDEPWTIVPNLGAGDVAGRNGMVGHRGMAARVGSRVVGDVTAIVSAYRPADKDEFREADAVQLHHIAVLLRLAMTPSRTNQRLEALSKAISQVLDAKSTEQITARVCDIIQEQINKPLENRGYKTKTIARLFKRGKGEIVRWGQELRTVSGTLETQNIGSILINQDCVMTRTILNAETRWYKSPEEEGQKFLQVTDEKVESYLTVPISNDSAVIGAINLETIEPNAYLLRDKELVRAIANVAAAAIFDHRDRRFSTELAELSAAAINPLSGNTGSPEDILDSGAAILYRLTGYAEMLIFEPESDSNQPWRARRGWSGGEADPYSIKDVQLENVNNYVRPIWQETFLFSCLQEDDAEEGVYHTTKAEGVADLGRKALGKEDWQETRSHMVMLLGDQNSRSRAVMLLFEQPFPVPKRYDRMFAAFAQFLESVDVLGSQNTTDVAQQVKKLTIEAKVSRGLEHVQHAIRGRMGSLATKIKSGLIFDENPQSLLEQTRLGLIEAEEDFDQASKLLMPVKMREFDLCSVLNKRLTKMQQRLKAAGLSIAAVDGERFVVGDPEFTDAILFHLILNALTHGKRNGANTITVSIKNSEIIVSDNGQPLTEETSMRMFDLNFTTGPRGGGAGLNIAREAAHEMGAELSYVRDKNLNCFSLDMEPEKDAK